MGVLVFIAFLFLAIVGAAYGGLFVYKGRLEGSLDVLTKDLAQLEDDLDSQVIEEMARVDRGLQTARSLLSRHAYTTKIFRLLQDNTLSSIQFKDFTYDFETKKVSLVGIAPDFVNVDKQLKQFQSLPLIVSTSFTKVNITNDDAIGFSFELSLNENLLRFK